MQFRLLITLSVATALFTTALGEMTVDEFVKNPTIAAAAPHLIKELSSHGLETVDTSDNQKALSFELPLLNDIVEVISLNIFNAKTADWSNLEKAKLKAIQAEGEAAFQASTDLTDADTRRASSILNTIYDTVINLPVGHVKTSVAKETAGTTSSSTNPPSTEEQVTAPTAGGVWNYVGLAIVKASDTVAKVASIIRPAKVCETTNSAYLNEANDAIFYSSLTQGLAGGALVAAPESSPLKNVDLAMIIESAGKLAIQVHLAQSIAVLAELDPTDPAVRAMTLLSLAADSPSADSAQYARDISALMDQGLVKEIPASVLRALSDQASLVLVTRGAGPVSGSTVSTIAVKVPFLRNVYAFSTEVLGAYKIGNILKYVFCPGSVVAATSIPEDEQVNEDIKNILKSADEVLSSSEEKVAENGEETVEDADEGEDDEDDDQEGDDKTEASADANKQQQQQQGQQQDQQQPIVAEAVKPEAPGGVVQNVKDGIGAIKKSAEDAIEMAKKKTEEFTKPKVDKEKETVEKDAAAEAPVVAAEKPKVEAVKQEL